MPFDVGDMFQPLVALAGVAGHRIRPKSDGVTQNAEFDLARRGAAGTGDVRLTSDRLLDEANADADRRADEHQQRDQDAESEPEFFGSRHSSSACRSAGGLLPASPGAGHFSSDTPAICKGIAAKTSGNRPVRRR